MVAKRKNETDDAFRKRQAEYMREYRKDNPPPPLTDEQKERARELRRQRVVDNPEKYRRLRSAAYRRRQEHEREYNREYRNQHHERLRSRELKRKYGITVAEYKILFKNQKGLCAICFMPMTDKNFDVDHCHETGRIRGLLCRSCNILLGHAKDDAILLQLAADYLSHGQEVYQK